MFILFFVSLNSYAQTAEFEVVPKQYRFEIGYNYTLSSSFDMMPAHGYGGLIDVGWKVQGFIKKSPVYITVPLGYTVYSPMDNTQLATRRMNYGWTIRHELGKDKKAIPFITYSLLLNSLGFDTVEGRVMGHQTQFAFGYTFYGEKRLSYFAKFEYSYMTFPHLGGKSDKLQIVEFKTGIAI